MKGVKTKEQKMKWDLDGHIEILEECWFTQTLQNKIYDESSPYSFENIDFFFKEHENFLGCLRFCNQL